MRSGCPPRHSICDLLTDRARTSSDDEFLRFEGRSLTFAAVEDETSRLAWALTEAGVAQGDAVAIMLPNGFEFPLAWLALAKLGAIVVPVNVRYRASDLGFVLRDSGARFAVVGAEQAAGIAAVRDEWPDLEVEPLSIVDLRARMVSVPPSGLTWPASRERLVTIQYTSGTTGFPKGCLLTHEYWLTLAGTLQEHLGIGPSDTVLSAQPFYYMDPMWNLVVCLMAGAPMAILPRFSASTFWRTARDEGATFFYCVGTMPLLLAKQTPDPEVERGHEVRLVYCSGIPRKLHAEFEARWGCRWRETYGSTELGVVLIVSPDDDESVGSGVMGYPVANREVRVVDDQGAPTPDGEVGELVVRGPGVMLGYHGDAEATQQWNPDGWARTGDLVVRDPDGGFRIRGRNKDMIRRGGENIAAAEVEVTLCEHPDVLAAACVPVEDELRGEEVKAFVQLRPGVAWEAVPPPALIQFVGERLARFKVPRFFEYVESFPLTPSSRVAKPQLLATRPDHGIRTYDAESGSWSSDE